MAAARPKELLRFALTLMTFVSSFAIAQKVPIALSATVAEDDQVGRQLIFEIKEAIRGSNSFRLIDETDPVFPRLSVSAVAEAADVNRVSTAVSFSYAYDDRYLPLNGLFIIGSVQVCGRDTVKSCARSALSYIDAAIESLGKADPALKKALYKSN